MLDDFAKQSAASDWSPADHAQVQVSHQSLQIDFPKYKPGDPAAWPRATRKVDSADIARFNGLRIDIENPAEQTQFLQLSFRDATDGGGQLGYRIAAGKRQVLTIRFDEVHPSGPVDWSSLQLLDIMRTRPASPMTWKLHRLELFADKPQSTLAGRMEDLCRMASDVLEQARALKLVSPAIDAQSAGMIRRWKEALRQPRGIAGKAEECRTELTTLHDRLRARILGRQLAAPWVAWTVPLGTAFHPDEALLQYNAPAENLSIYTARGQYEETIIRLTNLTENTQDLQLQLVSSDASVVPAMSLRRNQCVRAADRSVLGDALVPLDDTGVVSIAPYQTVEVWLRVDAKHHALSAGMHQAQLRIADLRSGAGSATSLPISITVRDFDLASLPQQFKVQVWAELFAGRSFIVRGHEQAALDNLLDYGVNVLHLEPEQVPWPRLTPDGELASPVDYRLHDQTIKFLRQKGNPMILIFLHMDDADPAAWGLRNGLEAGTPQWERGLKAWITDWTRHLHSLGLTNKDYAFYLTDEPGLEELDRYRMMGKIIRQIDTSILIYADSSEIYDDPKLNDELMQATDIWQPDETVGIVADPNLLPELKKYPGKQIWVYACRTGMRARRVNAYDYYRLMAWRAMRDGLTGIGYWSYCAASSTGVENPWDGTSVPGSGAMLVYPAPNGLLSSVRWELVRQSIDDTRYVQQLRQAAEKATSPALRSQINDLCGPRLLEIIQHPDDPARIVQWRIEAGQAIENLPGSMN